MTRIQIIRISGYCTAAIVLAFQLGCALTTPDGVSSANTTAKTRDATPSPPMSVKSVDSMMGMMDTTMGSYGNGREDNLILVTVELRVHREMMEGTTELSADQSDAKLPKPYRAFLSRMKQRYGLFRVADWPLDTIGVRCLVFEGDGTQERAHIISSLNSEPGVDMAVGVQMFDVQRQAYNDPYIPLQHGFQSIQAESTHQWTTGKGVTVAVIDTGLDITHPDLKQNLEGSRNVVDSDEYQFNNDEHGTGVAGVIAAAANNKTGMVGVAPGASLLPIKACWKNRNGSRGATCNTYTLAKALNIAIKSGVQIINLSLAGPRDRILERLVKKALEKNIIVVGAQDPDNKQLFPAAIEGIIPVGLPGDTAPSTVWAPGTSVLSTAPGEKYEFYTGSSFSTAHISGLAALVRQLEPDWTPGQILSLFGGAADAISGAVNACLVIATLVNEHANDCASLVSANNSGT